jgi:hypothetical protein
MLAHEHRWQHAWHAEEYGAGRNEKAFGYWENRRNQKCKPDFITLHGGSGRFAIRPVEIHKIQAVVDAA